MNPQILVQLPLFFEPDLTCVESEKHGDFINLHDAWQHPECLPTYMTRSLTIMRILDLIGPLDWVNFPERDLKQTFGFPPVPYAALIASEIIKLNENHQSLKQLHLFLSEHPGFISLLNFAPKYRLHDGFSFNTPPPVTCLPTERHLTRMLREIPNTVLQFLLADSVHLIGLELAKHNVMWGDCISLDTKHTRSVAWVKENNHKAYITERYNKLKQPVGDPDCRLGCKRRRNRPEAPQTPTKKPVSPKGVAIGEFYWGYGSGVVVTKVPLYGEFVLAELTLPFDNGDVSYFFPLMQVTEKRLGRRPLFGTFDAAFDAWYVYAHFYRDEHPENGFAAVPFVGKGGKALKDRLFSPEGLPICTAGLPMPLKFAFTDRNTGKVEHERGKYVCPLLFPAKTADACPIHHKRWSKGGCTAMMPTSPGARVRYTLDRDGKLYTETYKQRTAVERINSQAYKLGIERPYLRNGAAIANQNTLIYLLINLRFLHRLRNNISQADDEF